MTRSVFLVTSQPATGRVEQLRQGLMAHGFDPVAAPDAPLTGDIPVLVIWSNGDPVDMFGRRSELLDLAGRGRLVSVLFNKVRLSDDLAAHPVIDLVNWRGAASNVFFLDLVASLIAMSDHCPPPVLRGARALLRKRLVGGLTLTALVAAIFAFAMNVLAVQNNLCSINFAQPNISDACGYLGLGDKPKKKERLAWEARPAGSCEALREHIRAFSDGAFSAEASELLDARKLIPEESWLADVQTLTLFQPSTAQGQSTIEDAQRAALARGRRQAEDLCEDGADPDYYRYLSSDVEVEQWECETVGDRSYCAFGGEAICQMESKIAQMREECG